MPAWKSKAAPTPARMGASSRSRISAIHFSCLGWPVPTQTTSAFEALIAAATSRCSSSSRLAERRRVASDDPQSWVALAERVVESDQCFLGSPAVEEHPRAGRRRAFAVARHEVGSVDAGSLGVAEGAQGPDERLAVGDGHRLQDRVAGLVVLLGHHHEVDGGGAQAGPMPAGDHRVHPVHRALVIGQSKWDPEDLCARQLGASDSATEVSVGASMSTDMLVRAGGRERSRSLRLKRRSGPEVTGRQSSTPPVPCWLMIDGASRTPARAAKVRRCHGGRPCTGARRARERGDPELRRGTDDRGDHSPGRGGPLPHGDHRRR